MQKTSKKELSVSSDSPRKRYEKELVAEVVADFEKRREERRLLERQWNLNVNYLMGNQYAEINPCGELYESEKDYYWQGRNVYNHIAPIVETRTAKLSRVRPIMSVRASGDDDSDVKAAKMASKLLNSTFSRLNMDEVIYKATLWSETMGTAFYKIVWNKNAGKKMGELNGKSVYEGDISVLPVSPFEIFPDSLFREDICELKSLIHAKAMHVDDVYRLYGKRLKGEDVNVFGYNELNASGSNVPRLTGGTVHDNVLVIERYEAPNDKHPQGRVVTVGGGELLADEELPYINGENGSREFPFVRQTSIDQAGSFFGVSVIDRVIPIQRAYNAVKNRKHEYLNRVSMGVVTVEDGSVDTDALVDEGLSPGKVLIYRQGSNPPRLMANSSVPPDFSYEESRLEHEFINVSGVSEFSRNSATIGENMSGVALELMIEQDDTRLVNSAENIRHAVRKVGKQAIRLLKQFATQTRMMRCYGQGNSVELYYFNSNDLTSDDVVFDTENELSNTPAQKKNAIYEMLKLGLLSDKNGALSQRTKSKILELIGYGTLSGGQDVATLHADKAQRENIQMQTQKLSVEQFDDHEIHVTEHVKLLLTEDFSNNNEYKNRVLEHLNEHKAAISGGQGTEVENEIRKTN